MQPGLASSTGRAMTAWKSSFGAAPASARSAETARAGGGGGGHCEEVVIDNKDLDTAMMMG